MTTTKSVPIEYKCNGCGEIGTAWDRYTQTAEERIGQSCPKCQNKNTMIEAWFKVQR